MREERLDVFRVSREEDLLQSKGAHHLRAGGTLDGGETFVRVRDAAGFDRCVGLRVGVGHKREDDEEERTRVPKIQSRVHEEGEGGATTAGDGEEEREGTREE